MRAKKFILNIVVAFFMFFVLIFCGVCIYALFKFFIFSAIDYLGYDFLYIVKIIFLASISLAAALAVYLDDRK